MDITLEQARSFCALVDNGTYQLAAKELRKSHSAVVYAIGCFEKQCDLKLLNRSEYRTTLTIEGEKIYQKCKKLLEATTDLEQACADLSSGWEPSIKLVYDGVLSADPFLEIFNTFKNQKIPTTLYVYSDYLQGVEKSFLDTNAEFMISILVPKLSGLNVVQLPPVLSCLVAHRNHALVNSDKVWSAVELQKYNFFTVRGADSSLNLGTKELEATSTFHVGDFGVKRTAILKGLGFGWLPAYLIEDELQTGELKLINWEHSSRQELYPNLYYRKKKALGKASQMILNQAGFKFRWALGR